MDKSSNDPMKGTSTERKESEQCLVPVPTLDDELLSSVVTNISYDEWFILSLIANNSDPLNFESLIENLAELLKSSSPLTNRREVQREDQR